MCLCLCFADSPFFIRVYDAKSNRVYWKGQRIKRDQQYRRVSLTVRHLLDTRRVVDSKEDESDTIKAPDKYGTGAM